MNLLQKLTCLILFAGIGIAHCVSPEKYQATILNAAIGDALGRITEFVDTTDKIHAKFGKDGVTNIKQALMKHPQTGKTIAPYTDDTLLSVIMLETLLDAQEQQLPTAVTIKKLACKFADLFSLKQYEVDPLFHIRAHGPTVMNSLKEITDHINLYHYSDVIPLMSEKAHLNSLIYKRFNTTTWNLADVKREGGCGSVMRAWPVGLLFSDNIPLVIELADKQSQLTHRHPMARAASAALAVGVALAVHDKPVATIVEGMIAAAQQFDAEEQLYKTGEMLTSEFIKFAYDAAQAGKTPEEILGTHNKMNYNKRSTDGFLLGWAADEAVAAAVYLFVRHSNNPQQAIIEGVNTPGDSDSIASLAGALVGAKTGKVFEDKDIEMLENYEYLKQLAQKI